MPVTKSGFADVGDTTGIEGESSSMEFVAVHSFTLLCLGYSVGRVRVVFSLPQASLQLMFSDNPTAEIPAHLAYVEWYTPFANPMAHHGLHKISTMKEPDGGRTCSIVPIAEIRRSVHLFPNFGTHAPAHWTSSSVLDECDTFFVIVFTDCHLYRILN